MVVRVCVGNHPSGHVGIFVSRPGIDVLSANPTVKNQMILSTAMGKTPCIVSAGVGVTQTSIGHGVPGIYPFIFWQEWTGSTLRPVTINQFFVSGGTAFYGGVKWRIDHFAGGFAISKNLPADVSPDAVISWVAFNERWLG